MRFLASKDFLEGAEKSQVFDEFVQELRDEAKEQLLDAVQLRRQEDWSMVGHQVVGAEHREPVGSLVCTCVDILRNRARTRVGED